jgi:hypothetical protein
VIDKPEPALAAFEEPAPAAQPTIAPAPVRAPSRKTREPLPVAAGVLPQPAGVLPELATASGYSGMSLQEALRAAARQLN